jgi:hypothetical protein
MNKRAMPKTKLLLISTTLIVLALACNTLGPILEEPESPVLPSNTPVPLIPTNTPPPVPTDPPAEPPTEEPAVEPTPETVEPAEENANTLYVDDFSNQASGWDLFSNSDGFTGYDNGSYKIGVYKEEIILWGNPKQNFDDVSVEVITTKVSGGDDAQYGIICRHQNPDNFYALVVTADGYAAIRKRVGGEPIGYIAEWTNSPAILQGNTTNLLKAECVGDRLTLYANGVKLLEAFDSDLPNGDVGLIVGTFTATEVEVLFDNFIVLAP